MCIITTALVIYHLGYHCMKATMLQLEPTCSECRLKLLVLYLITAGPVGFRGKRKAGPLGDQGKLTQMKRRPQFIRL